MEILFTVFSDKNGLIIANNIENILGPKKNQSCSQSSHKKNTTGVYFYALLIIRHLPRDSG